MKIIHANYTHKGSYTMSKNILRFPSSQDLVGDEDIMSLFMGLVSLLKRNEQIKVERYYENYIKCLKKEIEILSRNQNH